MESATVPEMYIETLEVFDPAGPVAVKETGKLPAVV